MGPHRKYPEQDWKAIEKARILREGIAAAMAKNALHRPILLQEAARRRAALQASAKDAEAAALNAGEQYSGPEQMFEDAMGATEEFDPQLHAAAARRSALTRDLDELTKPTQYPPA